MVEVSSRSLYGGFFVFDDWSRDGFGCALASLLFASRKVSTAVTGKIGGVVGMPHFRRSRRQCPKNRIA